MIRLLSALLSICICTGLIACQSTTERIRPQTDQAQDLPPEYPEGDDKAGYSVREQDNNKNNYTEENDNDFSKNNYTEDANNIRNPSSRPNRAVGYWLPDEIERSIEKQIPSVEEAKAVIVRGEAYIGKRDTYIGIRLKKPLPRQEMRSLKQKITSIAKGIEPNINSVYISTDHSFRKAVVDYQKHVKAGFPDREMEKRLRQLKKVRGR